VGKKNPVISKKRCVRIYKERRRGVERGGEVLGDGAKTAASQGIGHG
jgi:hypothetical protein